MSGYFAGDIIAGKRTPAGKNLLLIACGGGLIIASFMVSPFMPVNKQLWTGTYALLTGGIAFLLIGLFYWLMELRGYRRGFSILRVFGSNAIALYILSIVIAKSGRFITVPGAAGAGQSLRSYIFSECLASIIGAPAASLAYPLVLLLLMYSVALLLYRKGISIRI